ncbi:two-component sensor histidine kinase [Streptomyces sp. NA04227]|uniref:sensor histidine kinase n=1 Tax=Streptomyces sp. NA04227 TaxID=2742136 RepID=UPI001591C246|nr:histidine kinase [Streptomyces sp. NA04227]QKW06736.1 two-component sensor histidine kinase [Streptomyces sp. NA04227]
MPITELHGRIPHLTCRHLQWLTGAGFVLVLYKSVYDALTVPAGLLPGAAASAVVAALLCAALPLCLRLPVPVAVVTLAGFLLDNHVWPLLVALYVVALRRSAPVALALTGTAYAPASIGPFRELVDMPQLTFMPCAALLVPLAFGIAARSHREVARSLARQLEHSEAANRLRDDRVRMAERARIAREMHDVLAHRLSLLVLHTGVLQRRGAEIPEPVRERLGLLRDTSAHALDDLRDLLGALRDRADPAPLTPTGEDLPSLIAESRAAGTQVRAHIAELGALPTAVRLAVHRIVQESLTNARKHAPGEPVDLTVTVGPREVGVRAVNACAAAPHWAQAPTAAAPDRRQLGGSQGWFTASGTELTTGGYGLIGVAERVAALHGQLTARRTADDRFLLLARLPVPVHPQEPPQSREAPKPEPVTLRGATG